MMCSWSQEEACSLPWATGKLSSLGFSTYPLGVTAGNYIPLNQGFPGHEKLKPWVINTLPQCRSPWASSRQKNVNNSVAWTLSHRFYSRPLTYARGQSGKSSWQFSSYLFLPQNDQTRLSARIATQTQRPWGQRTTHSRTCPAGVPTPSQSTAGKTQLPGCAGTTGTLQPQQHERVWHQQQRLD